ncbi:MAG: 2-amino-4-hydroxy-6-hydroxymethyldihydropteridine diphosphokinase [Campylobacteraceae bacterium]
MKKEITKNLSWHYGRFFPFKKEIDENYKNIAVIGIGSNIGDAKKRFTKLYRLLQDDKRVRVVQTSPILKNPPFGYLEQDDFFNAVMVLQTSLSAIRLLRFLLHVENKFKRERSFKNAPRTLDLDIIFFNTARIMQKNLIIPHPKFQERLSVLLPLAKIS